MSSSQIFNSFPTLLILMFMTVAVLIAVGIHTFKLLRYAFDSDARDQKELNDYLNSKFSSFEIGRFYERYIGYLFEKEGYLVDYHGALNGVEDLGRDLIARDQHETWVVQAKCWSKKRQVQEKYIYQLHGTLEHYRRESGNKNAQGIFITTTYFSPKAQEAARSLGIELRTQKLENRYPMIKCNVAYKTGEKIYHLPFDDHYDKVRINRDHGDFFAKTIKEATSQGFRRAKKYQKAS